MSVYSDGLQRTYRTTDSRAEGAKACCVLKNFLNSGLVHNYAKDFDKAQCRLYNHPPCSTKHCCVK